MQQGLLGLSVCASTAILALQQHKWLLSDKNGDFTEGMEPSEKANICERAIDHAWLPGMHTIVSA